MTSQGQMNIDALADVTVGIPTCDDDPRILRRSLAAITAERLATPPVIVDTSTSDVIRELVHSLAEPIRYVRLPENRGVGHSRNLIVERTDTRFVLFVDADAVPQPGWARAMVRGFATDDVALVGARIVPEWPRDAPALFTCTIGQELLGMLDLGDEPLEVPRVMGTSYALDRLRYAAPAPFRPEFGRRDGQLLGGEEVQLSLDVRRAGRRIRYEPAARVVHCVRPERLSWRWMARRLYSEGRETRRWEEQLEPFPRPLTRRDRAFQLISTPPFLAGRLRGASLRP